MSEVGFCEYTISDGEFSEVVGVVGEVLALGVPAPVASDSVVGG